MFLKAGAALVQRHTIFKVNRELPQIKQNQGVDQKAEFNCTSVCNLFLKAE